MNPKNVFEFKIASAIRTIDFSSLRLLRQISNSSELSSHMKFNIPLSLILLLWTYLLVKSILCLSLHAEGVIHEQNNNFIVSKRISDYYKCLQCDNDLESTRKSIGNSNGKHNRSYIVDVVVVYYCRKETVSINLMLLWT